MLPIDPHWLANVPGEVQKYGPDILLLFKYGYGPAKAIIARILEHYKYDASATIERGLQNGADASRRIAAKVDELIESGRITEERARERFEEPDFAKALQDLLLSASETPDQFAHDALANLIAEMLTAAATSRRAIMLRMAADALKFLNARQIKTLGLACTLIYVGQDSISNVQEYIAEVEGRLKPYLDLELEFDNLDLGHLDEVGTAVFSVQTANPFAGGPVTKSRLLAPIDLATQSLSAEERTNPTLIRAHKWMTTSFSSHGLESIMLTPVGRILGMCADAILSGGPFELDLTWDDPTTLSTS